MADRFTVWNEITPGEHDRRLNVNWDRAFHPNDAQHNTGTISPPIDLTVPYSVYSSSQMGQCCGSVIIDSSAPSGSPSSPSRWR
jgi:hypothetical protein